MLRNGRAYVITLSLVASAPRLVFAQPQPAETSPTPPVTPTPSPPPELTPEAIATSRDLFRQGVAAAQASRWEDARVLFAQAMQIRPAPILRFNLALACQNTNRVVEALNLYRQFLGETPPAVDPPRVAAAEAQIPELERRVARLRVDVTGDEVRAFRLDNLAQTSALLGVDIPVNPGPHVVELEGVAGDRQRREGALYEGESMRVSVELTRTPAIEPAGTHDWSSRTRSFGHWVARAGPGGRWIDWASRATITPPSRWREQPWVVAGQLGVGAPTGVASLSVRYFPQPWFGLEAAGGLFGAYGPSAALTTHARVTAGRLAFGLMTGLAAGLTSVTLGCDPAASNAPAACVARPSREASAVALSFVAGVTLEARIGSHFALRGSLGARVITNPADLRAMGDPATHGRCTGAARTGDGDPCAIYAQSAEASIANPFFSIDAGYGF